MNEREKLIEAIKHELLNRAERRDDAIYMLSEFDDAARAALSAIEGMAAIVPREPTQAMRAAAMGPDAGAKYGDRKTADLVNRAKWNAMLDASPFAKETSITHQPQPSGPAR